MTPGTVLITGAGRRIGRAIALDLARHGWTVAVHYATSRAEAEMVVDEITRSGGSAGVFAADLAVETETATLIDRVTDALGAPSALINNASRFERDEALDATRASWDLHLEPNLRAPFVLTQAFARRLPEGQDGAVINLIDERVWNLTPHFVSYTVSKSALWTLTRTLAMALAPRIRVNAIGPGPTLPSARQTEEQFRAQVEMTPLRRAPSLDDVANTVRFLLGAMSVTGQMIALDGGQHLGWRCGSGSAVE